MKLATNKFLREKIDEVITINQKNIWAADLLSEACNYTDFFDQNVIKGYVNQGKNEPSAMVETFYDAFSLDDDEETREVLNEYCVKRIKCLDPNKYLKNSYATKIKQTGSYNGYSLRMVRYEPYQTFPYDEIEVTSDHKEYSKIGYFKKPFSYLALCQEKNIWMSLNPNEIETMTPFIKKAHGNVLVMGLGMGYVPFMMLEKSEVKSITIIERDQDIINLFNKLLFPYFPSKNKITIIKDDAIKYQPKQKFDYIFADLWHTPEDGIELFVKLKKKYTHVDCWLETSMYALLRRCMITLIEESLEGLNDDAYQHAKTATDRIINRYYEKTKKLVIDNEDKLNNLLSDKTLIGLLIK